MKETTVQIDGMMSIFDGTGIEKEMKRRDGVVRVDGNFLSGTATIVYDGTRIVPDDIEKIYRRRRRLLSRRGFEYEDHSEEVR
jgi:hypothetical protein